MPDLARYLGLIFGFAKPGRRRWTSIPQLRLVEIALGVADGCGY